MKIVVTMPAFNEAKTIGPAILDIHAALKKVRYSYKILVVDDGSSDNTADVAKNAGALVVKHPINYGLAETFRTEIKECLKLGADVIVHIDADRQYVPREIPRLLAKIEAGYDLVLGSRFRGKIESMPWVKRMGNVAFSHALSRITGKKISDAQTGFRAFTKDVAQKIAVTSDHTYTQEQIIRAVRHKVKIAEVPVTFRKRNDKSRLISNPLGYAIRAWINIIRVYRDYQPLKFFGLIGGIIFSIGFIVGLYLIFKHLTTGLLGRHIGLMVLDILLLSISFQIILFGFLADMLKKNT